MPPSPEIHWNLQRFDEVDSTNRIASAEVLSRWNTGQSAEGIVIIAQRQNGGRGQHGRRWESPPGGLYLSAVLENVRADVRDRTALLAGVATVEAMEKLLPLQIRWPNDVVTHSGKKLAGILCEAISQGDRWAVVVGIGVNVQTQIADLPPDLQSIATSLVAEGVNVPIDALARDILQQLGQYARMSLPSIVAQVRAYDALRGKTIDVSDGPKKIAGTASGIADGGGLIVETGQKQLIVERGTVQIKN